MIKIKKLGVLGLVLATSAYLVGCNNNNQESSNKNSGNETPSSLDSSLNSPTTSETPSSLDSSLNTPTSETPSSSTSDNTSEKDLTVDEVFSLFKTTYNNMLDFENYSKGFTGRFDVDDEWSMEIDNDNVDLGEVNPNGNAWGEGEKEQFLNQVNESIRKYENGSMIQQQYVAYDLVNNVGYSGYYDGDEVNYRTDGTTMMYNSKNSVIAKDGDNYYLFNKNENNYSSDLETNYNKQLIGDEYYKEAFSNYMSILMGFGFGDFKIENIEDFVDSLKDDFVYNNDFSKDEVESNLSFSLEDDVYSLSVKMNWKEETSLTSSQGDNFSSEYVFTFKPDKYMEYYSIYNEETTNYREICSDNDNSGVIPLISSWTFIMDWHVSMEYEQEGCPTIVEDVTYEDIGNYQISIGYYIDGKYFSHIIPKWGTEVMQLDLAGADQWFKEDMQWYIDPECTIPFTAETWPCYSMALYTDLDSINDDYALVGYYYFVDDEDYQNCINNDSFDYRYYIYEVSGNNDFSSYSYAYLNGERIEKDDPITFISGQINYISFIG